MVNKLKFLGAAHTVTGSMTYLSIGEFNILVDAGQYQGEDSSLRKINTDQINLQSIDALFLTHAHLDHSGFLPQLINKGFNAPIFCTLQTKELVEVILLDAFNIQLDAIKKNILSKMEFTEEDIAKTLSLIITKPFLETFSFKEISIKLYPAGHILGAASILFHRDGKNICFSGDLGRVNDIIHMDPVFPDKIDTLILESTYGDRVHPFANYEEILIRNIEHIIKTEGVLIIPAFAIARTQIILKILFDLLNKFPHLSIPVFLDSPMGIKATDIYIKNVNLLNLSSEELKQIEKKFTFVRFGNDKDKLAKARPPFILISSSGMLTGGKVLSYLERYIIKDFNTILLTGFQAEGSLGRKLLNGDKKIMIDKKEFEVKATIDFIESLSAHSDKIEILQMIKNVPDIKKIFLNHGEDSALDEFKKYLETNLSCDIIIADKNKEYIF